MNFYSLLYGCFMDEKTFTFNVTTFISIEHIFCNFRIFIHTVININYLLKYFNKKSCELYFDKMLQLVKCFNNTKIGNISPYEFL